MTGFITPASAQETTTPATAPADGTSRARGRCRARGRAGGRCRARATGTEVAHGGEHSGVFPPFDSTTFPSQLLWLAITFGLLYWVISRIAAPRIASILEVRRDRIAGDLGEAERLRGETDAAVAAYEQSLADARRNAGAIATETREKVAKELDAKRHAIEADLSSQAGEAEARIADIKSKALTEVDTIAADTTEAIVSALIGLGTRGEAEKAVSTVRRG